MHNQQRGHCHSPPHEDSVGEPQAHGVGGLLLSPEFPNITLEVDNA